MRANTIARWLIGTTPRRAPGTRSPMPGCATRTRTITANDLLMPFMLELLGDVRGISILDLGCGEGGYSREPSADDFIADSFAHPVAHRHKPLRAFIEPLLRR